MTFISCAEEAIEGTPRNMPAGSDRHAWQIADRGTGSRWIVSVSDVPDNRPLRSRRPCRGAAAQSSLEHPLVQAVERLPGAELAQVAGAIPRRW